MKRIILAALVGVLVSGCAAQAPTVLSASKKHISLHYRDLAKDVALAFKTAEQHCQQYGKNAVQTVSTAQPLIHEFTSTFKCE